MMPLTQWVAPTAEGRAEVVGKIMSLDWEALKSAHLPYVVEQLSETKPYGPLRMFVAAVQAASGDRYSDLEPVVRSALPAQKVELLQGHGHLSR